MFIASRWFPLSLALSLTAIHIGLIGHDWWAAAQTESGAKFLREDLQRPIFDVYEFCGAWVSYTTDQSVTLGLNWPAYIGATLLHSLVNRQETCVDAAMTPRGQIVTAMFVLPLWFTVGSSIRRLALRRWCPAATSRIFRGVLWIGTIVMPFAILGLLFGFVGTLFSEAGVRLAGIGFWTLYVSVLSAERLRVWPFKSVGQSRS